MVRISFQLTSLRRKGISEDSWENREDDSISFSALVLKYGHEGHLVVPNTCKIY